MLNSVRLIYIAIILTLISAIVYFPALQGGFYHDDIPNLVYNDKVKIDELTVENVYQASVSSDASILKRPISMASFALNYYFFGEDPFSFKLTNLVLHVITSLLVFIFIFKITILAAPDNSTRNNAIFFASAIALIWAIHPLHVSTVAYIVQRMAILATMFSLLSIVFYIYGRINLKNNKSQGITYLATSAIFVILGVFCKENAILAPLLILLIELTLFRNYAEKNFIKLSGLNRFLLIFTAISFAAFIFYFPQINKYFIDWYNTRDFSLEERLFTQARIIWHYIGWYIFPNIQDLGMYHDDIPLSSSILNPPTTILSIVGLILTLVVAIKCFKKYPLISLGIGWFFVGHLLESSILPLEIVYEHRNYLPAIGLILAAAEACRILFSQFEKVAKLRMLGLFVLVMVLSIITFTRATQWTDPLSFAYFEVQHHPESVRANHALGMAFRQLVLAGESKYTNEAYKHLAKAATLKSEYIHSEAALMKLSHETGKSISPNLINSINNKVANVALNNYHAGIIQDLVRCDSQQCLLPLDACELIIESALSNPRIHHSKLTHSTILSAKATMILERGGDRNIAENLFLEAIKISPHKTQYYVDYVNLLLLMNRPNEAVHYLELAYSSDRLKRHTDALNTLKGIVDQYQYNQS